MGDFLSLAHVGCDHGWLYVLPWSQQDVKLINCGSDGMLIKKTQDLEVLVSIYPCLVN